MVSDLRIQPAEAQPNEPCERYRFCDQYLSYLGDIRLLLKIDGIKEAEKQAEVNAGTTEEVSFVVTKERPGRYSVFINGLSGIFRVATPKETTGLVY